MYVCVPEWMYVQFIHTVAVQVRRRGQIPGNLSHHVGVGNQTHSSGRQ